ncbi:MAG: AbrB/MazE/SpoVT family DNA-binding domain-containing protein [Patescibacteria group bacterium]
MNITVEIDRNGRILIPSKIRKSRNWIPGTKLVINEKGSSLDLSSKSAKIDMAINKFEFMKKKLSPSKSMLSDFLKFKNEEVKKENE